MEFIGDAYTHLKESLELQLFTLGGTHFTVWTLLYLALLLSLLVAVSRRAKRWLVKGILARREVELGVRQAVGTIFQYVFVSIGFLIILSTAGIDLTTLNVLAGAIGIGVGFGLQTIADNFISGLIILFERPIKVGDRIQVSDITGDVVKIAARATSIRTNDNIDIIVPNSQFISSQVINWSHSDREVRLHVPVGVSYSANPEKVRDALLVVAASHPGVLQKPAPDVIFTDFGESSLNFDLRVWTSEYITKPLILRSDLNFAVQKALKEHGIEIPFPQRDVHIRSTVALKASPGETVPPDTTKEKSS
jgi:small-conductance mechanosensitive channel